MNSPLRISILAAVSLALLTGCGERPVTPTTSSAVGKTAFPLAITDDGGRHVSIPVLPQRIVCLSPAHTENLYALGAGELVVAEDTYSDYPPEARSKAKLNCWPRIPLEQVVGLKPDLVIVLTQEGEELRRMEAAGLRVVQLFPKTYGQTLDRILLLGRITGRETKAQEIVTGMRTRADTVKQRVTGEPRVPVVFELDATDSARPFVAGGGAIYHELIEMAGGKNLFAEQTKPTVQVSAEQIIARNPEALLLGDTTSPVLPQSPELVRKRPGWSQIRAVRTGHIYGVLSDRITRPGPRLVEGLEEIAQRLHPDRFKER
jgi:iron complex transport system substrate-binding protein